MITIPEDPRAGVRLDQIVPIPLRAKSWFVRAAAANSWSEEDSVKYGGAVFMLEGMQYHHENFLRLLDALKDYYQALHATALDALGGVATSMPAFSCEDEAIENNCQHEAIAYINRMGQFFTFARSMRLDALMPTASDLMVFRNKFAAHRSMDAPRGETLAARKRHATAFGWHQIIQGDFPVYQILENGWIRQFHFQEDHDAIMAESMAVLSVVSP